MSKDEKTIKICLGSSCHSKGSYTIINKVKEHIIGKENIKITGSLCNDYCTNGPVITIDDIKYTDVNEDNIIDLLNEKL